MKDSKIKVGDFVAIRVKDTEYDYTVGLNAKVAF